MKYKGPNAFQSLGVEDIKCLGNLLGVLSKDDIRNINRNELHKAISGGLLKSINFQCTVVSLHNTYTYRSPARLFLDYLKKKNCTYVINLNE